MRIFWGVKQNVFQKTEKFMYIFNEQLSTIFGSYFGKLVFFIKPYEKLKNHITVKTATEIRSKR